MKTIHLGSPNEEEERSQHILYEHKEVITGIFMKGNGMSKRDDSRNNVAFEDPKVRESLSPLAHQAGLQEKPEQPPDPIIRWERFLPDRTLKVLLVENDDSTRQVVGALLRNCSYEVRASANGMQAWKIIEDLSNHVDLVLTESSFSGSGSGSESGFQTQKPAKTSSLHDSENNSGSNDEDNRCNSLNARDGSDNDSGTWVIIHPNPETFCNDWVPISSNGECQGQKEHTDEIMGKDLEIGIPSNAELQYETHPIEKHLSMQRDWDMNKDKMESDQNNNGIPTLESNNLSTSDERSTKASDLISAIANNTGTQPLSALQVPYGSSKIPECLGKTTDNSRDLPNLELSLKRFRPMGEYRSATHDDRNVLRRSEQSVFSRYHKSAAYNQGPTGCGGSFSPPDNSSEARKDSTYNMISSSNVAPLKQGSNGSSNNNEMCTTTWKSSITNVTASSNAAALKLGSAASSNKNTTGSTTKGFTKPEANKEETASISAFNYTQTTAVLHPKQIRTSTNNQIVHENTKEPPAAGVTQQQQQWRCVTTIAGKYLQSRGRVSVDNL